MSSDKELAAKLDALHLHYDGVDTATALVLSEARDRLDALASAGGELETTEDERRAALVIDPRRTTLAARAIRDVDRQAATIATLRQQIEAKDKA